MTNTTLPQPAARPAPTVPAAAGRPEAGALPDRRTAAVFAAKVTLLRLRRAVQELGRRPRKLRPGPASDAGRVVAESRTPLWSDPRAAERAHQWGKVHNLRRAARAFDGVVIPAGATFSFWRQLGRASRARGFVEGRMLQGGCMMPAVGGGLCQLSNALHDAALQAGCTVTERHAHSRVVPGSTAAPGRDATVAWNYVDLRFRPDRTLHLHVRLTQDELVLHLLGTAEAATAGAATTGIATTGAASAGMAQADAAPAVRPAARTCGTCAETRCFRHEHGGGSAEQRAILLDELWGEFMDHLQAAAPGGWLAAPRPGRLPVALRVRSAAVMGAGRAALGRSLAMRLAAPGAPARRAAAAGTAAVVAHLAARLPAGATELWVAQAYLPYLWQAGHLGGRRFSVLMTRPPMQAIQDRLDAAFAAHPDRPTLADYRADPALVAAEAEALAQADALVTPHADIAALFPGRAVRLPWRVPSPPGPGSPRLPRRIAFPGPTLARKGACEVRAAAKLLDLEVVLPGAELEGAGFWDGVRVIRPGPAQDVFGWLDGVSAVVQPALAEEQPRRLLAAVSAGVPVLAAPACGLDGGGVVPIRPLDVPGLVAALEPVLRGGAG